MRASLRLFGKNYFDKHLRSLCLQRSQLKYFNGRRESEIQILKHLFFRFWVCSTLSIIRISRDSEWVMRQPIRRVMGRYSWLAGLSKLSKSMTIFSLQLELSRLSSYSMMFTERILYLFLRVHYLIHLNCINYYSFFRLILAKLLGILIFAL